MKYGLFCLLSVALAASLSGRDTSPENGFPQGYYSGDPLPPATIYLTFDDGPAPDTSAILDILKAEDVKATFFINAFNRHAPPDKIGTENNLLAYKDVLKRMVDEGHVIGNHTFSHQDLAVLKPSQMVWQLDTLQKDLNAALGTDAPKLRLIRPPFGSPWLGTWSTLENRKKVADVVATRGLVMNWTTAWDSADSIDWVPGEAQRLVNASVQAPQVYLDKEERELTRLLKHADGHSSGVLLFHDTHPTSRDVLARVIETYKSLGYSFDTLEQYAIWRWGPTAFDALP